MIQKSLESRYHEAAMKKTVQMPPPPPSTNSGLSKVTQNFQSMKISSNGSINGVKNEDPEIGEVIDPNFFYKNLIQSKSTSFFVLDVRKSTDFKSSRLKHRYDLFLPLSKTLILHPTFESHYLTIQ